MKKLLLVMLATLACSSAFAQQQFFSHTVIRVPDVRAGAPWTRVITTQQEWETLYREQAGSPTATVPQIDFTQYRVVAGGLGTYPTGGARLMIERVDDIGNAILVSGVAAYPGPTCVVTTGITYPTIAVLIPQSTKPVRVSMQRATYNC